LPNRLLLVEDDDNLREALADNLELEGYQVFGCALVEQAKDWLTPNSADLIVLDIMLPDGDGYQLCQWIRQRFDVLVLMLTARSLEKDVVEGFEVGADDYVSKPYRSAELLARIKALLRRKQTPINRNVTPMNGFEINWQLRQITFLQEQQQTLHLTKTAFDILAHLFTHLGNICSREQILDAVWGKDVYVDNRTIDNFVYNLKKQLKLGVGPDYQIKTVRGVGYTLVQCVIALNS
jgi:DNA-binding response OmpR family regulator